jgi:hypothetical protein
MKSGKAMSTLNKSLRLYSLRKLIIPYLEDMMLIGARMSSVGADCRHAGFTFRNL